MSRRVLFDDGARSAFLPFTHSRPIPEQRIGILTLREKWEERTGEAYSWLTAPHLREKFPFSEVDGQLLINARLFPDAALIEAVNALQKGEGLKQGDDLLALMPDADPKTVLSDYDEGGVEALRERSCRKLLDYGKEALLIHQKWDLFAKNGEALKADHELLKEKVPSNALSSSNRVIGDQLFIGEGAKVEHATLNSDSGPVYIDKDAEVMEGAMIRGPFYLGPHAVVKMGAKIYGPTTVGPYSKVGGEVNNCIFFGYSNKAHDGFLGNSVVGEWCNLGADTNNSNLKNDYGDVKLWDYQQEAFASTGRTFCGLFMGDHSKCGIDTMFNTGTTIGFSANVFDAGFPPKFIPSFFWGGSQGGETFALGKAKEVAERMRGRRDLPFDGVEERLFEAIFERTRRRRET